MRVEQITSDPCAMCLLILQLGELSESDRVVYEKHLKFEHKIQNYWIER